MARRAALAMVGVIALGGAAYAIGSHTWSSRARQPLVEYEIRLPPSILLPDDKHIEVTLWSGSYGMGGKISKIRRDGDRPEVTGTFVIKSSGNHNLSLRLSEFSEGHWRLPMSLEAMPEASFSPWQTVSFVPPPMHDDSPLPPGNYEVRYRVRK